MALTQEQLSKLPKYAQKALQDQQVEIRSLNERIAALTADQTPSAFRMTSGTGPNEDVTYLHPTHGIEVILGPDPDVNYENVIGIYVEDHPVVGKRLRIMAEGYPSALHVVPQAVNVLTITTGRF